MGAGDLHFVIDCPGIDVQRTAEQIREAQNVVHLVRVVTATSGNDCIHADFLRLFRRNFRVGICHRENNRIVGHACHHVLCHGALHTHAKKDIRVFHSFFQRAQLGRDCVGRLPLVHAFGAALIDDPFSIANDAIVVAGPHRFQKLDTSDTGSTRTIQNDLNVLDLLS